MLRMYSLRYLNKIYKVGNKVAYRGNLVRPLRTTALPPGSACGFYPDQQCHRAGLAFRLMGVRIDWQSVLHALVRKHQRV